MKLRMILLCLMLSQATEGVAEIVSPKLTQQQPPAINYQGTVVARQRAVIAVENSAQLTWVIPLGSEAKKGDVIAKQNDASLMLKRDTLFTQIELESVKRDYLQKSLNRLNDLMNNQALSAQKLDQAAFDLAQSESKLKLLKTELASLEHAISMLTIRAPFSGVVSRHITRQGEMAMAGSPVVELINPASTEIEVNVPVALLPKLRANDKLLVSGTAKTGKGELKTILPDIHPLTQTAMVHLVPAQRNQWLAGEHVDVQIPQEQYFNISKKALHSEQGRTWVTVLREQRSVKVDVNIIKEEAEHVVVTGELTEADQISGLTLNETKTEAES